MPNAGFPSQTPPGQTSLQVNPTQAARHFQAVHRPNQSQPVAVKPAVKPLVYSRQDKQLVPNSPTQAPVLVPSSHFQAPVTAWPKGVPAGTPENGIGWADAGLGGALALTVLGIGGALGISQRRTRRPAAVRAAAPAVGTA
jgi:hypothetical protein